MRDGIVTFTYIHKPVLAEYFRDITAFVLREVQ